MKIAYIMRGVPGSGKSTVARQLTNRAGAIHSTDDYFYVDGMYRFDPKLLQEYHDRNFEAFCKSLRDSESVVVCDSTNSKRIHYERYVEAAIRAGYFVALVVMPHPTPEIAAERTIHNVPVFVIRRMIEEWDN